MEDILSPTHAFLDFDFSEFIDKNFDMSNDMFNSSNTKLSASPSLLSASHTLDDFLSCSDSGSEPPSKINTVTNDNYTHESPSFSLWSNIEELAFENSGLIMLEEHKTPPNPITAEDPPSLSCIDDFIKDPHSDLVQLVQQCNTERSLFQNLITHSLSEHVSVTPHQVLQQQQLAQQQLMLQQERQQRLLYQQQQQHHQQLISLHQRQNFSAQLPPQHQTQHPLDPQPLQLHQNNPIQHSQHFHQIQQQQQHTPASSQQQQQQQRKKKSHSTGSRQPSQSQQNKRVSKSGSYSSNNSSYTHSDSVNAQLLRELIRQAGRNNPNMRNNSMDSNCSTSTTSSSSNSNLVFPPDFNRVTTTNKESSYYMPMNGNYQTQQLYRHHPYYSVAPPPPSSSTTSSSPASTHSSRHNLPYHIQTTTHKKQTFQQQQQKNLNTTSRSSKNHAMGRPSMYSSDISQAQLLEIQAISRAQQDFIRAREQQEAEKEMMMKHQKKQQGI